MDRLRGRVALVTGASRGCGKGIATVLGEEGATVYVTGRSVKGEPTTLGRPGTIDETADVVTARGGRGIAVRCDHTDDAQVRDVNITWVLDRAHGHAFYEVVKSGTNKLTEQMADGLRRHQVACVAVSPGFMRLERMNLSPDDAAQTESAEFAGRAVAALAADNEVLAKSGSVLTTPALAREYGFTDVDGSQQSPFWDSHYQGQARMKRPSANDFS
jgi:NAD(P)-dependent dehydrogenase (short-subunit alcohol dehydrogenase family)